MSRLDRDREASLGRYDRDRDYSTINRYASLRDHAPSRAAFQKLQARLRWYEERVRDRERWCRMESQSDIFECREDCVLREHSTYERKQWCGIGDSAGTGAGVGNAMGANVRTLQEKHCLETSALLNALADSQEACRRLREENGMLRGKIEGVRIHGKSG
ncbi:hypothetical protein BD769DRAFT_98762 [Suillus cothurnatus]|nr:hypothetical protein BD769DRAFT_98762 [Suillus cothurnatus]